MRHIPVCVFGIIEVVDGFVVVEEEPPGMDVVGVPTGHIAAVWQLRQVVPWKVTKLHFPGLPRGWQTTHLSAVTFLPGVPFG